MIVVLDDLPVFRLLVKRKIQQGHRDLLPFLDPAVQTFASVADLMAWLSGLDPSQCQLMLLDYTFANGETIASSLPEIICHRNLKHSLIIGWSRNTESARDFRREGAHGFLLKGREESIVNDIVTILKQHLDGSPWVHIG